jgi:hypothetical protein
MIEITAQQLRRAANIQERIQSLKNELGQLLGFFVQSVSEAPTKPKKRRMSAAGRAAIAAVARARWAKIKGTRPARKLKRKLSAAGRARLSALAKARWKKAKARGKATL